MEDSATLAPGSASLPFAEQLLADYLADPQSVPRDWAACFEVLNGDTAADFRLGPSFAPRSIFEGSPRAVPAEAASAPPGSARLPEPARDAGVLLRKLDRLAEAYRRLGHRAAHLDPLASGYPDVPELHPDRFGLSPADLQTEIVWDDRGRNVRKTVGRIVDDLRTTYCRHLGVQFWHIDEAEPREWLIREMETTRNRLNLSRTEQFRILTRLTDAVVFDEFIARKFQGKKSFSLQGAEMLIPLLDRTIEHAGLHGIREIVIGMAHRGRLNVLANILAKSREQIFREFADADPDLHRRGGGDVKYHLGWSRDWKTAEGQMIHLSLCFNPSHLEYVNPVALGRTRAKMDRCGDVERRRGMCVLIHGDASFAGEGVVQEILNMSELPGYRVGGTFHIIINNQIGFTTGPAQGRSTWYATDVVRMLQSPIFHVNGEDPEAVAQAVRLAMEFRARFQRDVVIDMYCYRKQGHNETDEPAYTQPLMYRAITQHENVRDSYVDRLVTMGGVTLDEVNWVAERSREELEKELTEASGTPKPSIERKAPYWEQYCGGRDSDVPEAGTAVPKERLSELLLKMTQLPEGFTPHPKIHRSILQARTAMAEGAQPLDWGAAEALAFGTLLTEGVPIRLTGQDCERGTFSHRHAVLHDYHDDRTYVPLAHLAEHQGRVEICNSPLSEIGVLGFEYGYSLDQPDALVLWEAQFGDFVNTAQVIIDQFVVSAEDKWRRQSGLVLLLPHGFEGMGPEHSSARLERFLMMAAEDNIQVMNLTTPAQLFHALRRQHYRRARKPLVILTPKILLRHRLATSTLDELATGQFRRILPDELPHSSERKISRVLLCSGKIYYDLLTRREALKRDDVAILRFEQLYPLPDETIATALAPYADGTPCFWVQEEPINMGAWWALRARFCHNLVGRFPLHPIAREESASPATGSETAHKAEQEELLVQAFA